MEISAGGTAQGLKYKEILFASSTTMDFFSIPASYSIIFIDGDVTRTAAIPERSLSNYSMWTTKLSLNLQPLVWLYA